MPDVAHFDGGSLVDLIEESCRVHAATIVCREGREELTFDELWDASLRLASVLRTRGVVPGDYVGLWANQGIELTIAVSGILLSGAAYVPLDPTYPADRLSHICEHSGLRLIVSSRALLTSALEFGQPVVEIRHDDADPLPADERPLTRDSDAAYLLYTSGSTGIPKGVVVEHRSVMNLLPWLRDLVRLVPGDVLVGTASLNFDCSMPNYLLPMVYGGTLHALTAEECRDPFALAAAIQMVQPKALQTSPSMLRMLTEIRWPGAESLSLMIGGEKIAVAVIEYIAPRVANLFNLYGPTEATVYVTGARLTATDTDSPIGVAMPNVRCVILDEDGSPTPAGEPGELYICGAALARGYLNDPGRTAERFVLISLDGQKVRAYRTGDVATLREDGVLIVSGRFDDQIKLRGYRIEPGEIEHLLRRVPGVLDAAVVASHSTTSDEDRLVAFLRAPSPPSAEELRSLLGGALPSYMIPSAFTVVDDFPLTPNGKVDRKALSTISFGEVDLPDRTGEVNGPSDEVERKILELFGEALEVSPQSLDVDDDFFDRGGTSLRCVQLFMSVEEEFGIPLPLSTLVAAPTVRLLSATVRGELGRAPVDGEPGPADPDWLDRVRTLWSEVLDLTPIKSTDDFFSLGGSDADAEEVIRRLATVRAVDMNLRRFHEFSTAEQFAAVTQVRSSRPSLVPLNPGGSKLPFFCIAGAGELALAFLPLARLLGPDQPFYGLQAKGLEDHGWADFTLSKVARRAVADIRSVQPHGPYRLGGHSLGGVIAVMVAERLQQLGEVVELVSVFDTRLSPRLLGSTTDATGARGSRAKLTSLVARHFRELVRLPLAGLVHRKGVKQYELFTLLGLLQSRYARPLPRWSGSAALFVSREGDPSDVEHRWSQVFTGPWRSVPVPGDHNNIVTHPNVEVLAKGLAQELGALGEAGNGSLPDTLG